jgi:hypothetical protein
MVGRLRRYVKTLGILLILAALFTGMLGCSPGGAAQYSLRISSTAGGTVTTPGEGLFRYASGTVVTLVANPDRGYQFVSWVGNADTIANVKAATTTVTMNNHYFLIANFDD